MQSEASVFNVRIFIDVINPLCIKRGRPPLNAMDLVAFLQQKFRKVGTILPGDSGDECFFHNRLFFKDARALDRPL